MIENKIYRDENDDMSQVIRKYILDKSYLWNNEIINYIGYYWNSLDKKVKSIQLFFYIWLMSLLIEIN